MTSYLTVEEVAVHCKKLDTKGIQHNIQNFPHFYLRQVQSKEDSVSMEIS